MDLVGDRVDETTAMPLDSAVFGDARMWRSSPETTACMISLRTNEEDVVIRCYSTIAVSFKRER